MIADAAANVPRSRLDRHSLGRDSRAQALADSPSIAELFFVGHQTDAADLLSGQTVRLGRQLDANQIGLRRIGIFVDEAADFLGGRRVDRLAGVEPQDPFALHAIEAGIPGGREIVDPRDCHDVRRSSQGDVSSAIDRAGVGHDDLVGDLADRVERCSDQMLRVASDHGDRKTRFAGMLGHGHAFSLADGGNRRGRIAATASLRCSPEPESAGVYRRPASGKRAVCRRRRPGKRRKIGELSVQALPGTAMPARLR